MTHIRNLLFLVSAFLLLTCNELLTAPPGTADVRVQSAPTITVGETSCLITWSTSVPTKYILEYGTVSGTYAFATVLSDTEEKNHSLNLTGLEEDTLYFYRIKMFYQTFQESLSDEYNFTTTAETPPTIAQKARGVWIVGGCSTDAFSSTVAQVDLYDPLTDTWYPDITDLPIPVSFAAIAGVSGKIYVIGGFQADGLVTGAVQIYDTVADSWSSGTPMSGAVTARANITATVVDNKIYILGGSTNSAGIGWNGTATNYEYSIGGDSWTVKTAIAGTTSNRVSVAYDDVIYYLGGRVTNGNTAYTHVDGYMVTQNILTTGVTEPPLTTVRTGHSAVIYTPAAGPSKIVVIGGFAANLTATHNCFIFSYSGTGSGIPNNIVQYLNYPFMPPLLWQTASTYPVPIAFGSAVVSGDNVFFFGGTINDTPASSPPSGSSLVYSGTLNTLSTITWSSMDPMPVGRYGHEAVKF